MCKHLTWQRLLLLLLILLLPHVCHILATCATGIATPAPPSLLPPSAASALSWPAFCLHAKLHCPLNWSLLMKIATVCQQFAEYPLPHWLLALHSIPLSSFPPLANIRSEEANITDWLFDKSDLLGTSLRSASLSLPAHYVLLILSGKVKKCEITQCRL